MVLQARGVGKRFGGLVALRQFDFTLEDQKIAAIIGPNGAGKTTFFSLLTGMLRPSDGHITFLGQEITGLPPDRIAAMGIARTFQNIRLFPSMTVHEHILIGCHTRLRGWWRSFLGGHRETLPDATIQAHAAELLQFLDLEPVADRLAVTLPYAMQRRVEIARALASRPTLLLLDEPTVGMSPDQVADVIHLIHRLRGKHGLSMVVIEHNMDVVMNIADQVTVLHEGRRIAEGGPAEIQADPTVLKVYLGSPAKGVSSA